MPSNIALKPVVLILSSWSSGSTAVSGYLAKSGGSTCPPHQLTRDPRTPDSFESKAFRDALCQCVDERTLKLRLHNAARFEPWFRQWLANENLKLSRKTPSVILKHPLAAFFIEQIHNVCAPRIVIVTRRLDSIEATRRRRGWASQYGVKGASYLYALIHRRLTELCLSALTISSEQFLADRATRANTVKYAKLKPTNDQAKLAEQWINPKTRNLSALDEPTNKSTP